MPELPEIEVLKRDLEKEIVSRRIKEVEVRPGSNAMKIIRRHGRRKEFQDMLAGAKVDGIDRIGKLLLLNLDNDRVLVFDLGSSGAIGKTSASDEIVTHTHIVISFTIGGQLRFVDQHRTGEVFIAPTSEVEELRASLGTAIDPLMQQFTWHHFSSILEEKETGMKELLTDEKFIIGLGDLYSDEVLWVAGLRYDRPSNKLSSQDVRRLYRGMMETLQDSVRLRGTTWGSQEFHDLHGEPGQFQLELKVFEREGEPCRRCRTPIITEDFNGRPTYLCPQCQS
ncbi:MAG: bifunctional DNA-formamidopyrimidine glycosylase/DNA-(apurinic or apyrimidinic site) lyase [Actinomycetota bacterium]